METPNAAPAGDRQEDGRCPAARLVPGGAPTCRRAAHRVVSSALEHLQTQPTSQACPVDTPNIQRCE